MVQHNKMKTEKHTKEQRRQAQLIRRNMITRVKPSAKVYSRKKEKVSFAS